MQQAELMRLLDRAHGIRVLVLGDVMLDRYVYGKVSRVSPEAPIPVLEIERTVDSPGGAANVARNVASIGASVTLIGVIGDDSAGRDLGMPIGANPRIDARWIVDPARPTTVKTRYVADGQQMLRADHETRARLPERLEDDLLERFMAVLPTADIVVLSDYAKGVLSDRVTAAAIGAAQRLGRRVIVDPKAKDLRKYLGSAVLTPNRLELQTACGLECSTDESVERAARVLLDQGICESLVVTRGKDGMSVFAADRPGEHLRTLAKQVFDVSGAGDTAVAALALGLASGADVVNAAMLANLAAGIVVGKLGTSVVTAAELIENSAPIGVRAGSSKIFTLENVLGLARDWREQGYRIAFTNGCFDLLHPGHVALLDRAKRSADRLIVGLNSDDSVRRLKGAGRPIQSEISRATVLSSLKFVDAVVIFAEDTPLELIQALCPDVLVKGADYRLDQVVGADWVQARGGRVVLADLVEGESTTNMVRRVGNPKGP